MLTHFANLFRLERLRTALWVFSRTSFEPNRVSHDHFVLERERERAMDYSRAQRKASGRVHPLFGLYVREFYCGDESMARRALVFGADCYFSDG